MMKAGFVESHPWSLEPTEDNNVTLSANDALSTCRELTLGLAKEGPQPQSFRPILGLPSKTSPPEAQKPDVWSPSGMGACMIAPGRDENSWNRKKGTGYVQAVEKVESPEAAWLQSPEHVTPLSQRRQDTATWQDDKSIITHTRPGNKSRHIRLKSQKFQVAIGTCSPTSHRTRAPEGKAPSLANEDIRVFACPFLRKDPTRNMDCLNLRLSRPRDVKQHLMRRHYFSAAFCQKCNRAFTSVVASHDPATYDFGASEHVDRDYCGQCVPPAKQKELKKPAKKSLCPEDQWYAIWDLLFPEMRRPSPYLETVLGEGIGVVEKFWNKEGDDFAAKFLQSNGASDMNPEGLCQLVAKLLGHMKRHLRDDMSGRARDGDLAVLGTPALKNAGAVFLPRQDGGYEKTNIRTDCEVEDDIHELEMMEGITDFDPPNEMKIGMLQGDTGLDSLDWDLLDHSIYDLESFPFDVSGSDGEGLTTSPAYTADGVNDLTLPSKLEDF